MNRHIFTVRSGFMGFTSEDRAMGIKNRIKMAMEKGGDDHVSTLPSPEGGRFVELNGMAVFQVRPSDIDPSLGEFIDEVAIRPQQAINALIFLVSFGKWVLVMIAGYQWATFSFRQFPYTRPWGEKLQSYLIDTIQGILSAIVDVLPGLLVVTLIKRRF